MYFLNISSLSTFKKKNIYKTSKENYHINLKVTKLKAKFRKKRSRNFLLSGNLKQKHNKTQVKSKVLTLI